MARCFGDGDPLYERYHDEEWGCPVRGERALYERLVLEAFQSGLSWITILRKRENFRAAFADFDPEVVARYGDARRRSACSATPASSATGRRSTPRSPTRGRRSRLREAGKSLTELVWSFAPGPPGAAGEPLAELPATTAGVDRARQGAEEARASASSARRRSTRRCRPAAS